MKETNRQLLDVVCHVLNGTVLPDIIFWEPLLALAKMHNFIGYLYRVACQRQDIPKPVYTQIHKLYWMSVAQQAQQSHEAERIFSALQEKGIPFAPIKGEEVRMVYPASDLRFSCDIDFLYPEDRRKEVNSLIESFGYTQQISAAHNDTFVCNMVTVESHFALFEEGSEESAYYADVWSKLLTEDGIRYHFSKGDLYIYMLLHIKKHMLHGGAGIRSVIDLWLWNKTYDVLSDDYVKRELEKLGLVRFANTMQRLAKIWLEGETSDEDMDLLGDFIFNGGAYGTFEQKAQLEASVTGEHASEKIKMRFLLKRIFPPYADMCVRYPILKKASILLPFAWVVRLFATLFTSRRKHIKRDMEIASHLSEDNVTKMSRIRELIE